MKAGRIWIVCAGALSFVFASPLAAQTKSPLNVAQQSARAFAEGLVGKRPEVARAFVIESLRDLDGEFSRRVITECIPEKGDAAYISRLSFPSDTLHQLLSNALIVREFKDAGPTDFSSLDPAPRDPPKPESDAELAKLSKKARAQADERFKQRQVWYRLSELGECVSRRNPEGVRHMALTDIASAEERAAIVKLSADISACVPVGESVKLRPIDFRGPTLRSYYHLAHCLTNNLAMTKKAIPDA